MRLQQLLAGGLASDDAAQKIGAAELLKLAVGLPSVGVEGVDDKPELAEFFKLSENADSDRLMTRALSVMARLKLADAIARNCTDKAGLTKFLDNHDKHSDLLAAFAPHIADRGITQLMELANKPQNAELLAAVHSFITNDADERQQAIAKTIINMLGEKGILQDTGLKLAKMIQDPSWIQEAADLTSTEVNSWSAAAQWHLVNIYTDPELTQARYMMMGMLADGRGKRLADMLSSDDPVIKK